MPSQLTAVAPAIKNSTTSCAVIIPPSPITGIFTARATCQNHPQGHRLYGRSGRDPPVAILNLGRRVSISIAIPINVLIKDKPSAPLPASTAFCYFRNIRHVERKLYDEQFIIMSAHLFHNSCGAQKCQSHPAILHVRTRDI